MQTDELSLEITYIESYVNENECAESMKYTLTLILNANFALYDVLTSDIASIVCKNRANQSRKIANDCMLEQ